MAKQAKSEASAAREANKLYWGSDVSVNQIAEKMDLSKGRLYGLLVPLPTGESCPTCGTETEYANRTSRDRREAHCPSCAEGAPAPKRKTTARSKDAPAARPAPARSLTASLDRVPLVHSRALLGAALLGVAAGLFFAAHRKKR